MRVPRRHEGMRVPGKGPGYSPALREEGLGGGAGEKDADGHGA